MYLVFSCIFVNHAGNKVNLSDRYVIQMNFLRNHQYLTQTAALLRNVRKLESLIETKNLCTKGCDQGNQKYYFYLPDYGKIGCPAANQGTK